MEKIIFIDPGVRSGGSYVFMNVYKSMKQHFDTVYLLSMKRSSKLFNYLNLFFLLLLCNDRKNTIYIPTDPIQSLICSLTLVRYVRYAQADDLRLFKKRLWPFGNILCYLQKLLSFREKSLIYVSDYVLGAFNRSKFGGDVMRCFKLPPLLDRAFTNTIFLNKVKFKINNLYVSNKSEPIVVYMARKSPMKRSHEFFNWIKSIYNGEFKILIISQDFTFGEISSYLSVPFDFFCPSCQQDVQELLFASDILVYNSENEGFGLPPLEAKVCGLRIVTSDCGGVFEYIDNNDFVFQVGSFDEFKEKFFSVLELSKTENVNFFDIENLVLKYREYTFFQLSSLFNFIRGVK